MANNHENFAPKGNIVAMVPSGTGIMIMAADQVEVFDNIHRAKPDVGPIDCQLSAHAESQSMMRNIDPFCEAISIHDNHFAANGERPSGALGRLVSSCHGLAAPRHPL